ncbi:MAG: hypothetical protein WD595_02720 [Waddliaceae bacterium]
MNLDQLSPILQSTARDFSSLVEAKDMSKVDPVKNRLNELNHELSQGVDFKADQSQSVHNIQSALKMIKAAHEKASQEKGGAAVASLLGTPYQEFQANLQQFEEKFKRVQPTDKGEMRQR